MKKEVHGDWNQKWNDGENTSWEDIWSVVRSTDVVSDDHKATSVFTVIFIVSRKAIHHESCSNMNQIFEVAAMKELLYISITAL